MTKKELKKIRKELDIAMESGIQENMDWMDAYPYELLDYIDELHKKIDELKANKKS